MTRYEVECVLADGARAYSGPFFASDADEALRVGRASMEQALGGASEWRVREWDPVVISVTEWTIEPGDEYVRVPLGSLPLILK